MEDIKNKFKSMAVVMLMLVSVIAVSTVVTSTTVTNNSAPESTDALGSTNVLVMNFTINATDDTLIDSDSDTTYLAGSVDANVGDPLTDFVNTDDLLYYQNSTTDQFVLWVDDGTNRWFNGSQDTLLYNATDPTTLGANIDNTSGENITGTVYNSTQLIGGTAQGYLRYDDDGAPGYQAGDDIFFETDNNSCYLDGIDVVTFQNTGTANHNDIAKIEFWVEDGTSPGFQSGEEANLGTDSDGSDGWLITGLDENISTSGKTFYLTADFAADASNYSVKMKIPSLYDQDSDGVWDSGDKGLFLNSTDDTGNIVNENTQTIGKLGVTYYEGNQTGVANLIVNDHDTMYYGNTVNIKVDTEYLNGTGNYYLYKPIYKRTGSVPASYAYELQWEIVSNQGGGAVTINSDQSSTKTFSSIELDRAGMWVIDDDDPADANGTETNPDYAYFWVNNTSPYSIDVSNSDIFYGNNESITITVTEDGSTVPTWIDVRNDTNGLVKHSWEPDGTLSLTGDWTNFTAAGNYTVQAYYDADETMIGYGSYGYSDDYGYTEPNLLTSKNYSATCGPWDPYEKNASSQTIRVRTGVPDATVQSGNDTMYWGFDGEVNITIKGYDGENLSGSNAALTIDVYNDDDELVGSSSGGPGYIGTVEDSNIDKGYIRISDDDWGVDSKTAGLNSGNGTWYAIIYKNIDSDSGAVEYTEEWNVTVEWTVAKPPKGQFKWVDDDGPLFTDDNNDGVIPRVFTLLELQRNNNNNNIIKFNVYDEDGNAFGDLASGECNSILECAENISITGDALFTGSLDNLPGYSSSWFNDPQWQIPLIPTMSTGGGEITIDIDAFNTTITKTLSIGGTEYEEKGSVVEVTPSNFQIDQDDQTLSISVKNAETGSTNPYCTVSLYYLNDNGYPVNQSGSGVNTEYVAKTTASGGEYSLLFNITQQTENQTYIDFDGDGSISDSEIKAPRNLTIWVEGPGNRDGFARVRMNPVNDLEVELSHNTILAGKQYDDFYMNCTLLGNTTETPSEDDKAKFSFKILDEDGDDVTDTLLNGVDSSDLTNDGDYVYKFDNVYATEPGTYTIYAANNTHDSTGYNATLVVEQVTVTCDKSPLIWNYDENVSATFTVTYNGNPINGSLILDNISKVTHDDGDYNRTWMNTSFDGSTNQGGNSSIEIDSDELVNGVITIHDITANYLDEDLAQQNITFWFRPDSDDGTGTYAKTSGMVPISVPTVTPQYEYVSVGQTTSIDVTVTGRGTPLDNIYVGLHGRGIEQNGTSGTDGIVTFSVLPTSSGNISIDVGEEGRTVDTVIVATNWILDVSVSPTDVNEGEDFTVTVIEERSGDPVEGVTVKIQGVSTMTTDASGEATFTAPSVSSDRTYTIATSKPGYAPESDLITVRIINVPSLIISADAEVGPGTSFEVTVAKDTGDPVIGATVEFNGKTVKTKAGGVATLTAPNEKGDYTITASFGTFEDATTTIKVTETAGEGIPGFELLTLVAALGVAFILLRRRRQ